MGQRRGGRERKESDFITTVKFNMIIFTLNHSIGIYNNLRIHTIYIYIYSNLLIEINFILYTCHQRKPYLLS